MSAKFVTTQARKRLWQMAWAEKERTKPHRLKTLILAIQPNLPTQIIESQLEAPKEENMAEECLWGMDK